LPLILSSFIFIIYFPGLALLILFTIRHKVLQNTADP
jgi:hypothetical protein